MPANILPPQNLLGTNPPSSSNTPSQLLQQPQNQLVNPLPQSQPTPQQNAANAGSFLNQPQPQSTEQTALQSGKQGISAFMNANTNSNNNSNINTPQQTQQQQSNLINPNVALQNNGSANQFNQSAQQGQSQGSLNNQSINPKFINPNLFQPLPGPTQQNNQFLLPNTVPQSFPTNSSTNTQQPNNLPQQPNNLPPPITSDENLKTNIQPSDKSLNSFLSSINAYNYSYKEPQIDGSGTFTSPMAQELEATELGKQAVIDTPRGKMVNYGRLGGVNLAASAVLYKEQERIKSQLNQLQKQFKLIKAK